MKALILGISGQDGYWLARLLHTKGYEVHGVIRRLSSRKNLYRLEELGLENFTLHEGDITDGHFIEKIIRANQFDEIYNLAAQSFVAYSFENPRATFEANFTGHLNVLESIKSCSPQSRLYFAGTSEQYGSSVDPDGFQRETTPFLPNSPYAVAKLAAFQLNRNYREAYNLFACGGILFNHESHMRGEEFVTKKIVKHLTGIKLGILSTPLSLGNLSASRDWSHASDMVEAMYLMVQSDIPSDYVVASGDTHTVSEFLTAVLNELEMNPADWMGYVNIDERFFRPSEVPYLRGDSSKVRKELRWDPIFNFEHLVRDMVKQEIKLWRENPRRLALK